MAAFGGVGANLFEVYFEANLHRAAGECIIGTGRPEGEHAAGFKCVTGIVQSCQAMERVMVCQRIFAHMLAAIHEFSGFIHANGVFNAALVEAQGAAMFGSRIDQSAGDHLRPSLHEALANGRKRKACRVHARTPYSDPW